MLDLLEKLVNTESGSYDKDGVDQVGSLLSDAYKELGFTIEVDEQEERGNNLLITHARATDPKLLLIAHMDTVFTKGTVEKRPFSCDELYAYGPGVFDMKGSLVTTYFALKELVENNEEHVYQNVAIILNSDEEIGSVHSRPLIERVATDKKYAFIVEPSKHRHIVCNARKGGGKFYLHIHGKSAHAGVEPKNGESAVEELAHIILKLHALTNHEDGITVNVGLIDGGTSVNTIAPWAYAGIDLRMETEEQAEWLDKKVREILSQTVNPAIHYEIEDRSGISRPPFIPSDQSDALLALVQDVGQEFGWPIRPEKTGGGSDGNLTARLGVATIDGLGPIGGKAHQEGEFLEISSLLERKDFLKRLLQRCSES